MLSDTNRTVLFIIMFLSLPSALLADGSIYSLRGQGLLFYYHGGRATGMGGAVVAVSDPANINWLNPASLSMIDRVRFSAQMVHQNLNIQSTGISYKTNYTNFNGFFAGFSMGSGLGWGIGLQPVTKTNYAFDSKEEIDDFVYTRSVEKLGGLNRVFLATGFRVFSRLQLGINFGYVFGKSDENSRVQYEDPRFAPTFDQFRDKYRGLSIRLGTVLNPAEGLSIGGIYQTKYDLRENSEVTHIRPQTKTTSTSEIEIPALWGIGVAYAFKEKFLWAADFVTQDWRAYTVRGAGRSSEFAEFQRLSIGFEYQPSADKSTTSLKASQYRIGLAWEQPNILDYSGKTLSTLLVTAGIGVPFGRGSGSFDFALEYGQRGSLPDNNFKERIIRFSVYVSGSELWFQR